MAGKTPTFAELDARRKALPPMPNGRPRLSRAELSRRAGISASTIDKGMRQGRAPSSSVRRLLELALSAEEKMAEAGL